MVLGSMPRVRVSFTETSYARPEIITPRCKSASFAALGAAWVFRGSCQGKACSSLGQEADFGTKEQNRGVKPCADCTGLRKVCMHSGQVAETGSCHDATQCPHCTPHSPGKTPDDPVKKPTVSFRHALAAKQISLHSDVGQKMKALSSHFTQALNVTPSHPEPKHPPKKSPKTIRQSFLGLRHARPLHHLSEARGPEAKLRALRLKPSRKRASAA